MNDHRQDAMAVGSPKRVGVVTDDKRPSNTGGKPTRPAGSARYSGPWSQAQDSRQLYRLRVIRCLGFERFGMHRARQRT